MMLKWFKKNIIILLIIIVIIIILIIKFTSSDSKISIKKNKTTLSDGTYNCEPMYNGKSLYDDDTIYSFFQKLASYDSIFDVNKVDVSYFKNELSYVFSNSYIVKDNDIVKLFFNVDNIKLEVVSYDIKEDKYTVNRKVFDGDSDTVYNTINSIFNESIKTKLTKDSFTYHNFGFLLLYGTIYNIYKANSLPDSVFDIDYTKYTDLGDLVCHKKVNTIKKDNTMINNEDIYEEILTGHRQYLLGIIDNPPKGNIDYVFPDLEDNIKVHLAYTFNDLNHDGKDELIIGQDGSYYSDNYYKVFGIYRYDDNYKVKLIPLPEGNKNNSHINILEDGYFEVNYGWQSIQNRSIYGNVKNEKKVLDNWNNFGEILKYDFYEDSESNWQLRLDIYKNGKLIESHKSITWDAWYEVDNKPLSDLTNKRIINLKDLEWNYILPLD